MSFHLCMTIRPIPLAHFLDPGNMRHLIQRYRVLSCQNNSFARSSITIIVESIFCRREVLRFAQDDRLWFALFWSLFLRFVQHDRLWSIDLEIVAHFRVV